MDRDTVEFKQAAALATTWVDLKSEGQARIQRELTMAKPYGWIFFYQSNEYLDEGNLSAQLAGNAPIIVDRDTLELRITGTAQPLADYLEQYEKTLPPASLQRTPEPPIW
ncbi:YrhB domain-containing protein [Bradyrhizobium sp. HKCCYLS2038]|uniref:YrhB domain-containing protein n=1 Tax=unclassified Bradyrhizobium TaxID=2631580 RepID=UPI003EB7598B